MITFKENGNHFSKINHLNFFKFLVSISINFNITCGEMEKVSYNIFSDFGTVKAKE